VHGTCMRVRMQHARLLACACAWARGHVRVCKKAEEVSGGPARLRISRMQFWIRWALTSSSFPLSHSLSPSQSGDTCRSVLARELGTVPARGQAGARAQESARAPRPQDVWTALGLLGRSRTRR